MSDTATITPTDAGQGAPAPDTSTAAPAAAPVVETQTVQPAPGAEAQPTGGQDLVAPYLEGVDDAHRGVVQERLEQFRKDQDANVTRRFETINDQLARYQHYATDPQQLDVPVTLYDNLMEKPLETIQWVMDKFKTEAGLDLRSQLLEAMQKTPAAETPAPEATTEAPLTKADLERYFQEQRQESQAQVQRTEQVQTVEGWLSTAAQKHGLTLGESDAAVKEAILKSAAAVMPQFKHLGNQAGEKAVATAVEAFTTRFRSTPTPTTTPDPAPKVADGGTPPSPAEAVLDTPAKRKAFMLQSLQAHQAQE